MTHKATLRLGFGSAEEAARMAAALEPENEGFLSTRVEGSVLVVEASADAPLSLLRTLDDAIVCLQGAQRAGRLGA